MGAPPSVAVSGYRRPRRGARGRDQCQRGERPAPANVNGASRSPRTSSTGVPLESACDPQILLTNDDGIDAPGIAVLRRAVDGLGQVTTIAPDRNMSAVARGITVRRPLSMQPRSFGGGYEGFAVDGTPSDCVRVALLGLRCPLPDLVVSGVNAGGNMGADASYSGTVGAAFEAALRGHPGVAFSVEALEPGWLDAPVLRAMVGHVIERGLPRHSILNVNLPYWPLTAFTWCADGWPAASWTGPVPVL